MYLTIIFLPLFGSLFSLNRYCGKHYGPRLSIICKKSGVIISIGILYEKYLDSIVNIEIGNWINYGKISVGYGLYYDKLTVLKLLIIFFISLIIQIYSLEYKINDPYQSKFFSLLSLFTFTKIILVSSDNLLILFIGWEGVGIISYLLVNFWFTRKAANKASLSALFINKIGDYFLILGLILVKGYSSDFSLLINFSFIPYLHPDFLFLFILTFIGCSSAKSALIPLNTWLPKAKEGPTSVSALLHSSTKVTAGIYLLKRISPILEFSSISLTLVIWLGSLGALLGAVCGKIDNDIKRVIAKSTTSQLGYKIVAIGLSQYNLAIFHLFTHAFFKSVLFLSSGAILHSLIDNQDIRKKGSLIIFLPLTYLVLLFASLSLMAFPFTSGWYSKDLLIELLITPYNFTYSIAYLFTFLAAFLTNFYSIRLIMIVKFSRPNFSLRIFPKDSGILMTLPLLILSLFAVFIGYFSHEFFLGNGSIMHLFSINPKLLDVSNFHSWAIPLPLIFLFLFNFLFLNPSTPISNPITSLSQNISKRRFNITSLPYSQDIFNHWLKYKGLILSNYLYRYIDRGLLELFGPIILYRTISFIGFNIELFSTGYIPHYLFLLLSFFMLFLSFS